MLPETEHGRKEETRKKPTLNLYSHLLIIKDWPNQMISPPVRKLRRHGPHGSSSHGTKQGQETWRMNQQVGREGQKITSSEGLLDLRFRSGRMFAASHKGHSFCLMECSGDSHHFFPGDYHMT